MDAARQARWNAARVERAHAFKDRRRNRRHAFVQNQPELPQPPALPIGPSIEAMNANTLWQLGNRYHAVRPSVIREEVTGGYSSLMKAAGSLKRDNKNVAELHNYCIPNNIARFNQKRISQWRSKMRSCSERHTGLCCQRGPPLFEVDDAGVAKKQRKGRRVCLTSPEPRCTDFLL